MTIKVIFKVKRYYLCEIDKFQGQIAGHGLLKFTTIVSSDAFWGVLWFDKFKRFITNDCKGHIQGQKFIISRSNRKMSRSYCIIVVALTKKRLMIRLQDGLWRLFGVLVSDNFNCFITNECKGHIQGKRVFFPCQIDKFQG